MYSTTLVEIKQLLNLLSFMVLKLVHLVNLMFKFEPKSSKIRLKVGLNMHILQLHLVRWMVYSLVVRARGLEYGGPEFKSRSLRLKPETEQLVYKSHTFTLISTTIMA